MTIDTQAFQAFLYAHIPLVKAMQLELESVTECKLTANAPIQPNINDKATVFGGSSAALMTICGWSLIKTNLESRGLSNDVVIYKAKNQWQKAQTDDLIIQAHVDALIDWDAICDQLKQKNRNQKLQVNCQVLNEDRQVCSEMHAQYVILKK